MGLYRILLFFFLLPSVVFAESEAENQCHQRYDDILENCSQYSFDNQSILRLQMDRLSLDTDDELASPFSNEQFYFSGERCQSSQDYQYLTFVFKQRNSNGDAQCAVWRHYRDNRGEEWVEETVFRGENRTHTSRMTAEDHRNQPRDRELVLDPEGHNSLLNRFGRGVTNVIDYVTGGPEASVLESEK